MAEKILCVLLIPVFIQFLALAGSGLMQAIRKEW
jgi:hypothetical protein